MKRIVMYEVTIKGHEKTFAYFSEKSQIAIGPFKMNKKEATQYCRHLQKCMGEQVKVEFKKITITNGKDDIYLQANC